MLNSIKINMKICHEIMNHFLIEHIPRQWNEKMFVVFLKGTALCHSLFGNTPLEYQDDMNHESCLKKKFSLDVASRWEDINGQCLFFPQMKKK